MVDNRGGRREGAGRKKLSKDGIPRNTKKQLANKPDVDEEVGEQTKSIEKISKGIFKHLKGDAKKLYKEYAIDGDYDTSVHALKEIAKMMHVRHHTALTTELNEWENRVSDANIEIDHIHATGEINGKVANANTQAKRLLVLRGLVTKKLHLSSQLTTLEEGLIRVHEAIDRIESGRSETNISIYQILNGKGDKKELNKLKNTMCELPEEHMEEEDFDDFDTGKGIKDTPPVKDENES